jgi:hypothetical protein
LSSCRAIYALIILSLFIPGAASLPFSRFLSSLALICDHVLSLLSAYIPLVEGLCAVRWILYYGSHDPAYQHNGSLSQKMSSTMSIAIVCRFVPASNTRPRRISAKVGNRRPVIRSYPDAGDDVACYAAVALEALKLSGFGSMHEMVLHPGHTPDGYVFAVAFPWSVAIPVIREVVL